MSGARQTFEPIGKAFELAAGASEFVDECRIVSLAERKNSTWLSHRSDHLCDQVVGFHHGLRAIRIAVADATKAVKM